MDVILEILETLMWFCLTSLGAIIVGIIIGGYILAFVKKIQPDWGRVIALSLITLAPSFTMIWFGIQHNEWNIPVTIIWLMIIAVFNITTIKELRESNSREEREGAEAPQEEK